jgi:CBS domain-containing protein
MRVRDVMSRGVECIGPERTIQEAARKMRDMDVGPLPVCGDGERLVGMITDRDITVRATAEGCDPKQTTVREVMSEGIRCCFEDDDMEAAARLMQDEQLRRLVVLDENKRLVDIVALGDLATQSDDTRRTGEVLGRVSEPATV